MAQYGVKVLEVQEVLELLFGVEGVGVQEDMELPTTQPHQPTVALAKMQISGFYQLPTVAVLLAEKEELPQCSAQPRVGEVEVGLAY